MKPTGFTLLARTGAGEAFVRFRDALIGMRGPDGGQLHESDGILILGHGHVQLADDGPAFAIIGPMFDRRGNGRAVVTPVSAPGERLRESAGRHAIAECWGSYVLVLQTGAGVAVLRDPSGALPCYFAQRDGAVMVSSSIMPMIDTGFVSPEIDLDTVARQLVAKDLRVDRTCLVGVQELLRGCRLTIGSKGLGIEQVWDPWAFARDPLDISPIEAALLLRATISQCVDALAAPYERAILGVSGGLDSSIVAACLAAGDLDVRCITLATDDPLGDERSYSRILCEHIDVDLTEAHERLDLVDITQSHSDHLPRPLARSFAQSGNTLQEELADEVGADCFFTGAGGDNVFCYLASAAPVADRLLAHGPGLGMLATARDVSRMRRATLGQAVRKGMARAWLKPADYRWPLDFSHLTPMVHAMRPRWDDHPWLAAPRGGLPGKAAHIAWLLGIENHLEGFRREKSRPVIAPLMAQPVVELCLSIPSWMWCAGGVNRAIARNAFRDSLPRAIIERSSKGSPGPFVMQILDRHRQDIRAMLVGGRLAEAGLIETAGIEAALARGLAISEIDNARIMQLVDVEAWLRSWRP